MNRVSAVIITKNEERNIGRCLKSLTGIVDEIVVADSGSTDRTKKICGEFGVRFYEIDWEGYGATKNKANQLVTNDYILWVDADEEISSELKHSILEAKKNLAGCYSFNRLNNYCGKWIRHGGYYPDRKVRIFPKNKVQWKGEFVHEYLDVPVFFSVQPLEGDLFHYSYYSYEDHKLRVQKYAKLAAQKIAISEQKNLFLKMIFSPLFRFVKSWIFQLGFLDGSKGFILTKLTSSEVFHKYRLAIQLRKQSKKN